MSAAILYLFLSYYLFFFCSITNVGASSKKDVGKMPEEKATRTADETTHASVTVQVPALQAIAKLIEEEMQQRLALIESGKYNLVPSCIYSFS